jgi:hypothetical protein
MMQFLNLRLLTLVAFLLGSSLSLQANNAVLPPTKPGEVAVAFMQRFMALDFKGAKKYATAATAAQLDMLDAMMSGEMDKMDDEQKAAFQAELALMQTITFSSKSCDVQGDECTCQLEMCKDGECETQPIILVKENGAWKIDLDRNGANDGDMDGGDGIIQGGSYED